MKQNDLFGIAILLGIIAIAAFGGANNAKFFGPPTQENQRVQIEQDLQKAQQQAAEIQKQIDVQEAAKTRSPYYGLVSIQYVARATNPAYEYITLFVSNSATTTIPVSGWTLKSVNSGATVQIPKATKLFFANSPNQEETAVLSPGDAVYLVTGISPNGQSFQVNMCSGYLSQFQTFVPSLWTSCPAPRTLDLSSIPNRTINDACLDYINSMPSCRIQTQPLPANWSYECVNFIYTKINYSSCVDTFKNNKDFYIHQWYMYLKRTEPIWKSSREHIVLYDLNGKVVSEITY